MRNELPEGQYRPIYMQARDVSGGQGTHVAPTAAEAQREMADRSNFLAGGGGGQPFDPLSGQGGGANRRLPSDLSSLTPGQVYKTVDPKTGRTVYSGRDIKENAPMVDARGASTGQLNSDFRGNGLQVLDSNGRPVTTMTLGGGYGTTDPNSNAAALARMRAQAPAMPVSQSVGDGGYTSGQGAISLSGGGGEQIGMNRVGGTLGRSLSVLGPSGNAMKPRDIRAANALAAERDIASMREGGDMARASMREGGDMARANLSAGVQREGFGVQRENNALQRDVTMRGQDITREGHYLTVAQAQAAAQRAQDNADREYGRNVRNDDFTQGQQAIKDLHTEVASMIPPTTDRDGKSVPDLENAARYATALQTSVGRLGGSMKDLTAKDKARFVAGMQLADVASATATGGMTPWGTRAVQSNDPILALRKLPNGDYQTNRTGVNGETEVIPGRYVEKEGSTFGFGGRASNKFKALME
jgi:hypothetical protein